MTPLDARRFAGILGMLRAAIAVCGVVCVPVCVLLPAQAAPAAALSSTAPSPAAPSRAALSPVVRAQPQAPGAGMPTSPADSASLRGDLEHAVDTYERSRRRYAPTDWYGRRGGPCDEYIGRMCLTLGEGSDWWFPEEIPERMEEARTELVDRLIDGADSIPGDAWVLGQIVRYLGEGGEWAWAARRLDPCPPVERAWCLALRGLALHGEGRYAESESAYREALAAMDPARRRAWLEPGDVVEDEVRDHFDALAGRALADPALADPEHAAAAAPARDAAVERFWRLSDPFLLVEGNDRWTEHLARRTMIEIRHGRDSAYRIRFRDDLTEVTLRYGWEVGWERRPASATAVSSETPVVGHQHPYLLPWVAPTEAILDPATSTPRDWTPQSDRLPHTGYAPLYAPNVLPDGEVLVFPRGHETIVAAAIALPTDTSWHADHDHPPLPILPRFDGRPATSGLFALDTAGRPVAEDRRTFPLVLGAERDEIAGLLPPPTYHEVTLEPGDWIVSVEHVVPALGRAARLRRGLRVESWAIDRPALSDLLLLPADPEPATLEAALDGRAVRTVGPGEPFRVGWETWGLGGYRGGQPDGQPDGERESFAYTLTLAEEGGGVVDRVAGWLGLGGDDEVVELAWTELGPDRLGAHFRSVELAAPEDLDDGDYVLRLELATAGRNPLVTQRRVAVRR